MTISLVTIIRDYIELINTAYDLLLANITFKQVISITFQFSTIMVTAFLKYVFTFQWLRDLCYLPIIVPQITLSVIKENYFLENNLGNFFTFLESPVYNNNKFFIGFLNSFFLSLPITCSQVITLRRLFIQGIPAGFASLFGNILGQSVLLLSIWLGLRFLIIPWFSLEPFTYLLGIFLIMTTVYDMAHERSIKRIPIFETLKLFKIFFLNFLLSWTEQSCIFQYLGNLTLNAEPTILDIFSSNSPIESFFIHLSYFFGIFSGSMFFSILFGFSILKLADFYQKITNTTTSRLVNKMNFFLLCTIVGLSFSSIPYYSVDYLFLGPLGFVSQDRSLRNTMFSNTTIKDSNRLLGDGRFKSINVDVSRFDRGEYLKHDPKQSFEELNYQGEYAVTTMHDRLSSFDMSAYDKGKTKNFIAKFFKNLANKYSKKSDTSDESTLRKNTIPSPIIYGSSTPRYFILNQRFNEDYERGFGNPYEVFDKKFVATTFQQEFLSEMPKRKLASNLLRKYYTNPMYKALLITDIDLFNQRQPKSHQLTAEQEKSLFEKRLKLADYYNSLRAYKYLPYSGEFEEIFYNSKSYANRVYNQQYKGTLKILRRLFSLTVDENYNKNKKAVLKFDKPLFKNDLNNVNPLLHEELKVENAIKKPFIEETNPIPLYAGWDEQLRKLVITNRLMPRYFAGFEMKPPTKLQNFDYQSLNEEFNKERKQKKRIAFTLWPLPKRFVERSPKKIRFRNFTYFAKDGQNIRQFMYFAKDDLQTRQSRQFYGDSAQDWNYESLPINLKFLFQKEDFLPLDRGGFIWPGTSTLKLDFEDIKELALDELEEKLKKTPLKGTLKGFRRKYPEGTIVKRYY